MKIFSQLHPNRLKQIAIYAFLLVVLGLIASKAIGEGWFAPRTPIDLAGEPALLFFNRHKGCTCALVVYQAADRQINGWSEKARQGLRIIEIDLDRRPDLEDFYAVYRPPELMLVDPTGQLILRQGILVSDTEPFDLQLFETTIQDYLEGPIQTSNE